VALEEKGVRICIWMEVCLPKRGSGRCSNSRRKRTPGLFDQSEGGRSPGLTDGCADYVYLVRSRGGYPAAEQQDRSTGESPDRQEKKVFAYRMICKDTVEEKILQLQEKKRSLAADLIADEGGFCQAADHGGCGVFIQFNRVNY